MQNSVLIELRERIDGLDEQLVQLLAQRFRVTEAVGNLKAAGGMNAADPVREAQQEQRLSQLAEHYGVSPALVKRIFHAVVEEVVSTHEEIAKKVRITPPEQ
jgi:chorismate mutase